MRFVLQQRRQQIARENEFEEDRHQDKDGEDRVALPSMLLGSPAWTTLKTAKDLNLARKLGNPHFLITQTFNSSWPEVREKMVGENAQRDPVLCTRVFHCRLKKLLGLIKKQFGTNICMVSVIKFQRRGFPHAHLIIRVHPALPFEEVDQVVTAELARHLRY